MGPAGTFAAVTFAAGLICILGWFYATTDNPRSGAIFKKSLLIFVLPIFFAPTQLFLKLPLGLFIWAAAEEGLKVFASTREVRREDKFWLILLFGIWELTVSKPLWGVVIARSGETWDRLSMMGLIYATALPVLMHALTAAIYAFTFERRLWAAFIASWVVHATFNASVDYFSLSPTLAIVQTILLTIMLCAVLSRRRPVGASNRI